LNAFDKCLYEMTTLVRS